MEKEIKKSATEVLLERESKLKEESEAKLLEFFNETLENRSNNDDSIEIEILTDKVIKEIFKICKFNIEQQLALSNIYGEDFSIRDFFFKTFKENNETLSVEQRISAAKNSFLEILDSLKVENFEGKKNELNEVNIKKIIKETLETEKENYNYDLKNLYDGIYSNIKKITTKDFNHELIEKTIGMLLKVNSQTSIFDDSANILTSSEKEINLDNILTALKANIESIKEREYRSFSDNTNIKTEIEEFENVLKNVEEGKDLVKELIMKYREKVFTEIDKEIKKNFKESKGETIEIDKIVDSLSSDGKLFEYYLYQKELREVVLKMAKESDTKISASAKEEKPITQKTYEQKKKEIMKKQIDKLNLHPHLKLDI